VRLEPATQRRLAHGVFFAAVWALVATSPPRWVIDAKTTGRFTASAPNKGLLVTIDASHAPSLVFHEGTLLHDKLPCLDTWAPGTKVTCLLQPGATLDMVEIGDGKCAGGGGGCSECKPPAGAFVNADSKEVDVWADTDRDVLTATVPSHGPHDFMTYIEVTTAGAEAQRVALTITPHGGGPTLLHEERPCATCTFMFAVDRVTAPTSVDIVVEAAGWGACSSGPCPPPKTFHVTRLRIKP